MRTALIKVVSALGGGYEARLDLDWDGHATPGADAPRVSFDAAPTPPTGFADWITFLLQTDGASSDFHALGCALHDLLIVGDVGSELRRAQANGPFRLLLRVEPAELDILPWEFMREGGMLTFTDASRPTARVAAYFDPGLELPQMCWPLRMMLVVGSEDGLDGPAHVKEEINYVTDAFRKVCGLVDLEVVRLPNREHVRELNKTMRPHVFHFVGHGDLDDDLGGYLRLDQKDAPAIQWTASAIRDDLADGDLRLAVLNACQTGVPTERDGTRAAAQGLAELRVPAVIAMQGPIRGRAAARFAKGLYEALSTGVPLDRAVARARVAITDVASANQRDYALPSLILGAPPERILDLSHGDPSSRLNGKPLNKVLSFVDRVTRRRQLWDRLRPDQQVGPKIFAVTGPVRAGKGSLVRWCLGVASVQGYPVALADFGGDEYVDSVSFLEEFATVPTAGGASEVSAALGSLRADLAVYRAEQMKAAARDRPYDKDPTYLYKKLSSMLATVAAEQTLVIGIDGLAGVEMGAWLTHAVPWLVRPIARGLVGNIRLIVALQENERDVRFSPRYFGEDQIEDISIKLFPWAEFVELVSQRLRALDYTRESFDDLVNDVFDKGIKSRDYWDTQYFELLDMHARVNGWEQE